MFSCPGIPLPPPPPLLLLPSSSSQPPPSLSSSDVEIKLGNFCKVRQALCIELTSNPLSAFILFLLDYFLIKLKKNIFMGISFNFLFYELAKNKVSLGHFSSRCCFCYFSPYPHINKQFLRSYYLRTAI